MTAPTGARWVRVIGGPLADRWLLLDPGSKVGWHRDMMEGRFDSFIYAALLQDGNLEAATAWDVGAHIGYHSFAFAALVGPRGRVVAFEPNLDNIDRFQKHLDKNSDLASRISLLTCALSDTDGDAAFVSSSVVDDGTSSGSHLANALVPEPSKVYERFVHTTVDTARADTLVRENRVPAPTFMKVDVEGAEHLVLRGAVELLLSYRPTLFIEVHHIQAMFQVQQLLLDLDYTLTLANGEHGSPSRCFVVASPTRKRSS